MKVRYVISMVLGLVLAGGVVVASRLALPQAEAIDHVAMIPVYVASADIPFAAPVTEDRVSTQLWPRDAVPPLAFTDPEHLFPEGQGARLSKAHIVAGEPLIANKLSAFGEDLTEIPIEDVARRAMVIRVRGEASEGGLITPGDRLDLVLVMGKDDDRSAVELMQNVRVIGVQEGGLMTVEIARREAQKLALAQEAGELIASLHLGWSGDTAGPDANLGTLRLDSLVDSAKIASDPETKTAERSWYGAPESLFWSRCHCPLNKRLRRRCRLDFRPRAARRLMRQ